MTGIAAFVKRYPDTLAGYNTMSDEKKKNVDLQGMVSYIYRGMLIVSWSMVPAVYITAFLTRNERWYMWGMPAWIVAGMIIVCIGARKFDNNRRKRKQTK